MKNKNETQGHIKKRRWKRWAVPGACLLLIIGAVIILLRGVLPMSGNSLGRMINGDYYYANISGFYRYDGAEYERLMSAFNVNIGWMIDNYGLYYVKAIHCMSVNTKRASRANSIQLKRNYGCGILVMVKL